MTDEQSAQLVEVLDRIAVALERGRGGRNDVTFYGWDGAVIDPQQISLMNQHVTWFKYRDD